MNKDGVQIQSTVSQCNGNFDILEERRQTKNLCRDFIGWNFHRTSLQCCAGKLEETELVSSSSPRSLSFSLWEFLALAQIHNLALNISFSKPLICLSYCLFIEKRSDDNKETIVSRYNDYLKKTSACAFIVTPFTFVIIVMVMLMAILQSS